MHWFLVGLSALLVALGWYDVYQATVNGTGATNTMSFAGALGGIATMIVGCAMGILARVVQASAYHAGSHGRATAAEGARSPEELDGEVRRIALDEVPQYEALGWKVTSTTNLFAYVRKAG